MIEIVMRRCKTCDGRGWVDQSTFRRPCGVRQCPKCLGAGRTPILREVREAKEARG